MTPPGRVGRVPGRGHGDERGRVVVAGRGATEDPQRRGAGGLPVRQQDDFEGIHGCVSLFGR